MGDTAALSVARLLHFIEPPSLAAYLQITPDFMLFRFRRLVLFRQFQIRVMPPDV